MHDNWQLTVVAQLAGRTGVERLLYSNSIDFGETPLSTQRFNFSGADLGPGAWLVVVRLVKPGRPTVEYPLTVAGVPTFLTIATPPGKVPAPWLEAWSKANGNISNLNFADSDINCSVYYQLQNRGVAANPAAWINVPPYGSPQAWGQVFYVNVLFASGRKTLYAKATRAGYTDSDVVSLNL